MRASARRRGRVVLATAAIGAVTGCPAGGGPTSPDPVRFVLEGARTPCRIVFGPVGSDMFGVQEVGEIDTPDGPTFIRRGVAVDDRGAADLEIDGIAVHLSSTAGTSEVVWQLPPVEIAVSTGSLTADELRELLPALVRTADAPGLAARLVERIDGAELRYAGPAPTYDVGLWYDDGTLAVAGRGVADAQLDAFYAVLGGQTADGGAEWRADVPAADESRARDATVIVGSGRDRAAASGARFAAVVDELLGEDEPTVAVAGDGIVTTGSGCDRSDDGLAITDAAIRDVSIVESDVGDLLRVTFAGLPSDRTDRRFVRVTVGAVDLVAAYDGDEAVLFPATLTHDESRLLAGRLTR